MVRQGAIDVQSKPPFVMGFECAGEVEAVAADVTSLQVGDRVIAFMESKAWSELVTCNAKHVYKLAKNMEYQEAIAITMNYVVAYALLFDVACLRPGQSVLIHSVGGGVVSPLDKQQQAAIKVMMINITRHRDKRWPSWREPQQT